MTCTNDEAKKLVFSRVDFTTKSTGKEKSALGGVAMVLRLLLCRRQFLANFLL